ncbi:MAG: hypothetical protein KDC95_20370 [Planctomycetes bacterium]|nr:hypothetical protein [Planctomycetota bacterium]
MIAARIACFTCFALCISVGEATSQTFVVDAAGGPGSQYRDLPAAIAAVPAGSTLVVRAGKYSPFTVKKSLNILGVDSQTVSIEGLGAAQIGPCGATENIVLHGLGFRALVPLIVLGTQGTVSLSALDITTPSGLTIIDANMVHISSCNLATTVAAARTVARLNVTRSRVHVAWTNVIGQDAIATTGTTRPDGGGAVVAVSSELSLVASNVLGGKGAQPFARGNLAGFGGVGIAGDLRSTISMHACLVVGGNGGFDPNGLFHGSGGAAITLTQSSSATVEVLAPRGGTSGDPLGQPGPAWNVDSTSKLALDASVPTVVARQEANPRPKTIRWTVSAPSRSLIVPILGVRPTILALGTTVPLLVEPLVVLAPLPSNATGTTIFDLDLSVVPSLVIVHAQFGVVLSQGRIMASNVVPIIVP